MAGGLPSVNGILIGIPAVRILFVFPAGEQSAFQRLGFFGSCHLKKGHLMASSWDRISLLSSLPTLDFGSMSLNSMYCGIL